MAWLCINNFNGKDCYSMWTTRPPHKGEFRLGTYRFIEISDAEAALPLDKLIRLYKSEKAEAEEIAAVKAKDKLALADLIHRIGRIIKESSQEGEVATAKGFYQKITGKEWVG